MSIGHQLPARSDVQSVPTDQPLCVREVFEEYGAFVLRTVRRLGVRSADVEDVAQEVFVVVHRKLGDFRGRALRAWLVAITRRVASDHRRRAHVRREHPSDIPLLASTSASQEHDVSRARLRAVLDTALDVLDEDKRAVFVLYELEGMKMAEIAEALGCRVKTGYSRLHAARAVVREHVERVMGERHGR